MRTPQSTQGSFPSVLSQPSSHTVLKALLSTWAGLTQPGQKVQATRDPEMSLKLVGFNFFSIKYLKIKKLLLKNVLIYNGVLISSV